MCLAMRLLQILISLPTRALTRRRATNLNMGLLADRLQLEHGVERRHFQNADLRHVEQVRDIADCRLTHPTFVLFLRTPQKRNDRGGLTACRITVDQLLCPVEVLLGEREAFWLFRGKSANCHGVIPVLSK